MRRFAFSLGCIVSSLLAFNSASLAQTSGSVQETGGFFGEGNLSSSNTGTNPNNGLNINTLLGANRFYTNGYTGTRSVVGILEAGHIWSGHETLTSVNTFIDARATYTANGVDFEQLGDIDRHATWVAHSAGGRASTTGGINHQRGIAYGTTLWSAAFGTGFGTPAYSTSFEFSRGYALTNPLERMLLTGENGQRADVVNGSFSFGDEPAGDSVFAYMFDGMAVASRRTLVFSAGNRGPGANTMNTPAAAYNGLAVGATGTDFNSPPYRTVSNFSSRGPQDYSGPDGNVSGVRARVDIVAPGQNLTLAFYGGTTGGNTGGTDPTGGAADQYTSNAAGTSFSAPIVSGGAALLVDVGYDRFAANSANATDGRVIKAVLMNSADKLAGWNNAQSTSSGVTSTTQALDFAQGAGQMNLDRAFDQYTAGTTDVLGTGGGTGLAAIGWDYGSVAVNSFNDYAIGSSLLGGSTFNATLNWWVARQYNSTSNFGNISATDLGFTNLSVELWRTDATGNVLVARSDTAYNNTEHFSVTLTQTGTYFVRVNWVGERYDVNSNINSTDYALAWFGVNVQVPEPGTALLVLTLLPVALVLRRRVSA